MTMSASATEIYRTTRKSACEERALVLAAVGIPSSIRIDGGVFLLEVEDALSQGALTELAHYERESRPAAPPPPPPPPHPQAWVGCVVYVAVLLGVAHAIGNGALRGRAAGVWPGGGEERGGGGGGGGGGGRAGPAPPLPLDVGHLIANLG